MKTLDSATLDALREGMGYTSRAIRCSTCRYFVETDCSGNHDAARSHCTLNPSTGKQLTVEADGLCEYYTPKGLGLTQ